MVTVRRGATRLRGNPIDVIGEELEVGQTAPDFELVGQDLNPVTLEDTTGRVRIFSIVTSIDTAVCATETRRWQEEADRLGDRVEIITVSMDLPFAQRRWCSEAGVSHRVLSAHHDESFGEAWGLLIRSPPIRRILQRAVLVLDQDDQVRYAEYCREIADQPDFDRAIAVAESLVQRRRPS